MSNSCKPRHYTEWNTNPIDRAEDAAYTFGYYLMLHCRSEALKKAAAMPTPATRDQFNTAVGEVVDLALHNVADLLEGFWRTGAGPHHRVEFALAVRVKDANNKEVDRIDISPCLLDLPIGYWKWRDGEFR